MIIIFFSFIVGGFPAPGVQDLYQLNDEWLIDLGASSDLDHWFCVTTNADNGFRLIADGEAGEWFEEIDPYKVVYSNDGAHLAYVGTRNGRQVLVRDGREEKAYDKICGDYEQPFFSADGKHLAYTARNNDRYIVARDGKESPVFDGVRPPVPGPGLMTITGITTGLTVPSARFWTAANCTGARMVTMSTI